MDWQSYSTHEHAAQRFATALLPIGTIEGHDGGPVGTDNFIPDAICRRLAQRMKIPRLPLMPYGITSSLLAYPGGCSLSPETLGAFFFEIGQSLKRNGLRRLVVINGHGGNTRILHDAAQRLFRDADLYTVVIDWWPELQDEAIEIFGAGGMGHSAVDEMAALLGFCPEFEPRLAKETVPSFYNSRGLRAYPSPRPVMTYDHPDDPVDFRRLTPEKCAQFADRITERLVAMLQDIFEGWDALSG